MTKPKTKPTPKPTDSTFSRSKAQAVTGQPIPAPSGFNYSGLLEQIAMSMQDLVAEMKAMSEIPSLLDDVLGEMRVTSTSISTLSGEMKTMSTSMSTLSASLEEYLRVVDDDDVVDEVSP